MDLRIIACSSIGFALLLRPGCCIRINLLWIGLVCQQLLHLLTSGWFKDCICCERLFSVNRLAKLGKRSLKKLNNFIHSINKKILENDNGILVIVFFQPFLACSFIWLASEGRYCSPRTTKRKIN